MFLSAELFFLFNILLLGSLENRTPAGRIFYGSATTIEQHPYMVHVTVTNRDNSEKFLCAAVLLSDVWAVSSGFCGATVNSYIADAYPIHIYANRTDWTKADVKVPVLKAYLHMDGIKYVPLPGYSDISLLKVDPVWCVNCRPIRFSRYLTPNDSVVTAVGWGERGPGSLVEHQNQLHQINLIIKPLEFCFVYFGKTRFHPVAKTDRDMKFNWMSRQFCAILEHPASVDLAGPCMHDEGGPVLFNGMLIGIIPRLYRCPWPLPYLFVDVALHYSWMIVTAAFN